MRQLLEGKCYILRVAIFTIFMIYQLVPDSDRWGKLIDDSMDIATSGSIWRSWTGRDSAKEMAWDGHEH